MRHRRGVVTVTLAMGIYVVVCPLAAAETPLAFAQAGSVTASCESLQSGVKVDIRNETAKKQQIHLLPIEFVDTKKTPVDVEDVCGGLEVEVAAAIGPGEGATATLRAAKTDGGEALAELSGELSLFADEGGVAHRAVSIFPKAPAKGLATTPLVESKSVKLTKPASGPVWVPVERTSGRAAEGVERQPVGAVSGTNGNAVVVYSGKSRLLDDTDEELKLELARDDLPPGAYSGKVDLNPGNPELGEVTLELKIARCVWIAIGFLAIGIIAAVVLQWWSGRYLPSTRLRKRINELNPRHKEAVTKLKAAADNQSWGKFEIEAGDLVRLQTQLREQVGEAARRMTIQIDKKVLESLEAAIAVVESEIDLLTEIPQHADDLETELQSLGQNELGKPGLDQAARTALNGSAVRADQLESRIEEIDARTKQAQSLVFLQRRMEELDQARDELEAKGAQNLKELDDELGVARRLLWETKAADELDSSAKQLQEVAKAIAKRFEALPEKPPIPPYVVHAYLSTPSLARMAFAGESLEPLSESAAAVAVLEGPEGPPSPPPPLPLQPPAPALGAEGVSRETKRARVAQGIAVAVAIVVAIASGLVALYTGNETWGSCADYLAAAIWGLGAQAAVSSLATTLDGVGALWPSRR